MAKIHIINMVYGKNRMEKFSVLPICGYFQPFEMCKILINEDCVHEMIAVPLHPKTK